MSQVNLLPRELKERQQVRRQAVLAGLAGAAVIALLVLLYFWQTLRLADVNAQLEDQRAENAQLQGEITQLQRFEERLQELEARRALVATIEQNEVSWSGVLRDISLVIPNTMWLTDMNGAVSASTAGAVPPPEGGEAVTTGPLIGSIQFNGVALDTQTVALWLTRLEQVRGWVNSWLSTASKGEIAGSQVINFSSSIDLSSDAAVQHGGGQA